MHEVPQHYHLSDGVRDRLPWSHRVCPMYMIYISRKIQSFHGSLSFLCRTLYIWLESHSFREWVLLLIQRSGSALVFAVPAAKDSSCGQKQLWQASCLSVSSHVTWRCFLEKNKADLPPNKLDCQSTVLEQSASLASRLRCLILNILSMNGIKNDFNSDYYKTLPPWVRIMTYSQLWGNVRNN